MRLLFLNHIQNARQSLRSTRTRTYLTVIGIAIGVASITLILSLSSGISRVVAGQVDALGGNVAVIRPGVITKGVTDFTNPSPYQGFATSTITERDVQDISGLDHVDVAAPIMIINGNLKTSKTTLNQAPIVATKPALISIANIAMRDG